MELNSWLSEYPLLNGWSIVEECQVPFANAGTTLHLTGLVARRGEGPFALGSAAGSSFSDSMPRAFFELLERQSIVEADTNTEKLFTVRNDTGLEIRKMTWGNLCAPSHGTNWVLSRSNGVAAGPSFEFARQASLNELIERDRLLRSWFGETLPLRIVETPNFEFSEEIQKLFSIESYNFGNVSGIKVTGVFGFPNSKELPMLFGFGAGNTIQKSLSKATSEMKQRMGFLWEDSVPTTEPAISSTPNFHQDFFLFPENHIRLKNWLSGAHYFAQSFGPVANANTTDWVDVTPSPWVGKIIILKAINPSLAPLTFGVGHPWLSDRILNVHPFC